MGKARAPVKDLPVLLIITVLTFVHIFHVTFMFGFGLSQSAAYWHFWCEPSYAGLPLVTSFILLLIVFLNYLAIAFYAVPEAQRKSWRRYTFEWISIAVIVAYLIGFSFLQNQPLCRSLHDVRFAKLAGEAWGPEHVPVEGSYPYFCDYSSLICWKERMSDAPFAEQWATVMNDAPKLPGPGARFDRFRSASAATISRGIEECIADIAFAARGSGEIQGWSAAPPGQRLISPSIIVAVEFSFWPKPERIYFDRLADGYKKLVEYELLDIGPNFYRCDFDGHTYSEFSSTSEYEAIESGLIQANGRPATQIATE